MISAFEQLSNFGLGNIILILLLSMVFVVALIETVKKLFTYLGLETKANIKERELNEKIENMEKDIEALQKSANKFNDDRVHDREQSFAIQDKWTEIIHDINDKQNKIIERVDALAEQNRKYELADIRETLLQAYRYYTSPVSNPSMAWTAMEAHAFWEQYKNYVERKGNGYIENTVAPAMHKLNEIPMNDYEAISELMESRHSCKK